MLDVEPVLKAGVSDLHTGQNICPIASGPPQHAHMASISFTDHSHRFSESEHQFTLVSLLSAFLAPVIPRTTSGQTTIYKGQACASATQTHHYLLTVNEIEFWLLPHMQTLAQSLAIKLLFCSILFLSSTSSSRFSKFFLSLHIIFVHQHCCQHLDPATTNPSIAKDAYQALRPHHGHRYHRSALCPCGRF